jgi:mono/diheme cytochrome c family protein
VRVAVTGLPSGQPSSPTERRVDAGKLADMNAFLAHMPIPQGADVDPAAAARGKKVFVSQRCIDCHQIAPQKPLPNALVDLKTLCPAYKLEVLGDQIPPFASLANSPSVYDDKLVGRRQ